MTRSVSTGQAPPDGGPPKQDPTANLAGRSPTRPITEEEFAALAFPLPVQPAAELPDLFKTEAAERMRRGVKVNPATVGTSMKKAVDEISKVSGQKVSERYGAMAAEIKAQDPGAFQKLKADPTASLPKEHEKV